jgi:hypothetical protein
MIQATRSCAWVLGMACDVVAPSSNVNMQVRLQNCALSPRALSVWKVGADMTYNVCTPEAALPLKTYSPDLIVLPLLPALGQQEVGHCVSRRLGSVSGAGRNSGWQDEYEAL